MSFGRAWYEEDLKEKDEYEEIKEFASSLLKDKLEDVFEIEGNNDYE